MVRLSRLSLLFVIFIPHLRLHDQHDTRFCSLHPTPPTPGVAPHYTPRLIRSPPRWVSSLFYHNLLGSAIATSDFLYFFLFQLYHSRLSSLRHPSLIALNLSLPSMHVSPRLKSLFFYKSLPKYLIRLPCPSRCRSCLGSI